MKKDDYCSHIEIKSDKENPVVMRLYIDGHEVKGVRRFNLEHEKGYPVLKLDLNAFNTSVDGFIECMDYHENGLKITTK